MKLNENACLILLHISLYLWWQIFFFLRFLPWVFISVLHGAKGLPLHYPYPTHRHPQACYLRFDSHVQSQITLRCEPLYLPNRWNGIQTDQDTLIKILRAKSVKRKHALFQDEMESAICAHRPSHTKYFIDNKHCWDWCEAESVRDGRKRRKGKKRGKRGRERERTGNGQCWRKAI